MRHANSGNFVVLAFLSAVLLSSAFGLSSCGSKDKDDVVVAAPAEDTLRIDSIVEGMYRLFIDQSYEAYAKMQAGCDGKPKEYVEQTVILLKLLRQRMDSLHRGPKDCRMVRYERHGKDYIDAFLEVQFRDTTSEVILLPMILQDGKWRMR